MMAKINVKTTQKVIPMIYAYSTPEIARHNGWIKIGYTERQTTEARQRQQSHTVDVELKEEWKGNAIFDDGSGDIFHDTDFHAYLNKLGIENKKGTEWFHINGPLSKERFNEFRSNRGVLKDTNYVIPYTLRNEQKKAIEKTIEYFNSHEGGEFLWNAKPRFGKTLCVYDFCKKIDAKNVLIVTNRPAIANSWYSDYEKFLGEESGYQFVSSTESLKGKKYVISRAEYVKGVVTSEHKCIEFVSLQDLKGSIYFGGEYDKLKEVGDINWDVLVIDEAHEGVDTYKTDIAFEHIKRKFTLHLSGTPFKALANDKFLENAIFNWTYVDEQKAKAEWNAEDYNPYKNLPKLNLFTYQMSEIVKDELKQGIEIQGEIEEYAFDLNEFFATDKNKKFIHEKSVDKFLDALTKQEKFPFSTQKLRDELNHTFWLLNRVDSVKALAKKLEIHPVFKDYKIISAVGNGKLNEQEERQKSFDKVKEEIAKNEKTITLSVGQLTTGVTIPEWTAVLILSNVKSPSLYMQAAFRAQNPCLFSNNGQYYRKENAYVFDFDPARTLDIFEKFANDLSIETSDGKGYVDKRKENIRSLLNFFPVIGEDENGEMIELNAEKVLSIPRKIRSQEVVRSGFISNFLFQNVYNVFHAPMKVRDIIGKLEPVKEPKKNVNLPADTEKEFPLDENGDIVLSDDYVSGKSNDIFGDKIFDDIPKNLKDTINNIEETKTEKEDEQLENLREVFHKAVVEGLIETAEKEYDSKISRSDKKKLERKLKANSDDIINKAYGEHSIAKKKLKKEYADIFNQCETDEDLKLKNQEFEEKNKAIAEELKGILSGSVNEFVKSSGEEIVRTVETKKREQEKKSVEDSIKDHLRGFSRTIPSFLMAYGDDTVTLENFDKVIPDEVFLEVTSITLDQFRFLRDGGSYKDESTGEENQFVGNLFDPVVFNDSIKEFLRLKIKLANYFEETSTEDIFDYIPSQKTNQIFTPKWVVKKMVDMLEEENPGCFDMPNKTFIDLYMKSGLYIAEIVKRLYQSKEMKKLYPDKNERLKHIFKEQVYGIAPTEIIYKIATNFILGFDNTLTIKEHNFKQMDTLECVKNGSLEQNLDILYSQNKKDK